LAASQPQILVCSRQPDKQRSFSGPFQLEFAASSLTDRAATKYWHRYQHLAFGTGARGDGALTSRGIPPLGSFLELGVLFFD
jgi:hypothetical protein